MVVVGGGPAGVHFAERLAALEMGWEILLLGDEPRRPYDRVRLSALLARELDAGALYMDHRLRRDDIVYRADARVVRIDRTAKAVYDRRGHAHGYSKLVLATGSRPRVPTIPGVELPGVFVFRSIADAERLLARQVASRATVVIGGGLLGLEAARAMLRYNTRVHVIEHERRLMFQQLDDAAAAALRAHVEHLGIDVHVGDSVKQIVGVHGVQSVILRSGAELPCDTVIVTAGIVPNKELALEAGIAVGRGIRVNDRMQTSDPDVYAVGECCEHRGHVYGLVAPGLEQAAIAASNVAGRAAEYAGSIVAASLKVVGCTVFSMGDIEQSPKTYRAHVYRDGERYRRLNVHAGRIVGAVGFGGWDVARLRAAALERRRVWPWQLWAFRCSGKLWREEQAVGAWPPTTVVCACRGVTRGALSAAIAAGASTVAALAGRTGASTVCGSCRPLLASLVGGAERATPRPRRALFAGSAVAAALATAALVVALPYSASMTAGPRWDVIWTDSLHKQASGYALVGLASLLSVLGARKRVPRFSWGSFAGWQLAHVLAGAAAVLVLLAHTGFRLGANLDRWLAVSFTALLLAGGIGGTATAALERRTGGRMRTLRAAAMWAHVLLLWPLPVLAAFHVLKSYYF